MLSVLFLLQVSTLKILSIHISHTFVHIFHHNNQLISTIILIHNDYIFTYFPPRWLSTEGTRSHISSRDNRFLRFQVFHREFSSFSAKSSRLSQQQSSTWMITYHSGSELFNYYYSIHLCLYIFFIALNISHHVILSPLILTLFTTYEL